MKYIIENIYNFSYNKKYILIECEKHNVSALIIDGTIDIIIINSDNENIGINGLEINDTIKIYYKEFKNNMIYSIKIIKLNNYKFNDMSSSSEEYIN
jgi:hypothetical protein